MPRENDHSDNPAAAKKLPEEIVPSKATLAQFIETNSKLVTSIAAFIALTAFSSQLDNNDAKLYISALSLLAAVLLVIELFRQLPPQPHHWLLEPFLLLLPVLIIVMGEYWVSKFTAVWTPLVASAVNIFVFVVLPGLFAVFVAWIIGLVANHLFHRQIPGALKVRISQFVFFGLMGLIVLCYLWVLNRFGGRTITIPIPHF